MEDMLKLWDLVQSGEYYIIATLVIGWIVRELKSDTKLPINVPARLRPLLAIGLGQVSASIEMLSTGVVWYKAVLHGLLMAAAAMAGHDVVIGWLRDGKELPSIAGRKAAKVAVMLLAIGFAFSQMACMSLEKARGPSPRLGASPELSAHCKKLDRKVRRSNVALYVGAGLAGGAIVPALSLSDEAALYAGAGTAAAGAAIGLVALPIKQRAEQSWARDCTQ